MPRISLSAMFFIASLLLFSGAGAVVTSSGSVTLSFSNGNSIIYGSNDLITASSSNALNVTEIAIDGIVVANTLTANSISSFNFLAYGEIPYLDSNVVAGSSYAINAISTNSVNLVALGKPQGAIGDVASNTLSISKASPPLYISVPLDLKEFSYGTLTQFNQIPVSLYVNNALVSNTITGLHNTTITGFDYPLGAAFSPNGAYAYVINNNNTISVVNTSTRAKIATISGFDVTYGVAFSQNGAYAYVTNYDNNTISVVNTSTRAKIATISGFYYPLGVAFSPNGAYAYVTNNNNNTISVVSTSTRAKIATIRGFDNPYGVAFSPNGAYAYVANYANKTVSVVNTSSNAIIATISGFDGPTGVAFSPLGAYAYVTNYLNSTISVVNTSTHTKVVTISGFDYPFSIAISPNGSYAYVTNFFGSTVSIINTGSNSYKFASAGTYSLTANTLGDANYTSNTISMTFNVINESITVNTSLTTNTSYVYNTKAPTIKASLKSSSASGNIINTLAFTVNTINAKFTAYTGSNVLEAVLPSNISFATAGNYIYTISSNMQNDYQNSTNTIVVYNDIIPATIGISIKKSLPLLYLQVPQNLVYNGSNRKVFYSIFTFFNQIPVSFYVNNALVSNTITGIHNTTITGFGYPNGVAFSPNGAYAYVTNIGNFSISVVNTSTRAKIATIPGFDYPYGVAFSPSGAYAYVTNSANNTISVVNTSTRAKIATIPGFDSPYGVAISPNGAYAYVVNVNNFTISVVNTSTRSKIATIPGFDNPYGVAISPNGAYAYVANANNFSISVVNTSTHTKVAAIPGFYYPLGVAFSPNGAYAYVINSNGTISVVNTSTRSKIATIPGFDVTYGVAFSPNGAYAYVTNYENGTISVINTGSNSYGIASAGTYALTANTLGNDNYTSNSISALFTISKVTPTLQLNVCSNYTYSGNGCTITASIASIKNQLKGYAYIDSKDVANTTYSSNSLAYNALVSGGKHIVVFNTTGNTNYTANSIKENFTVFKAVPSITLPNFPKSFTYNGRDAIAQALISNVLNNQLQANVFIDNTIVASFYSSANFGIGPNVGNYTVVANTLGNDNYTSASVSNSLEIYPVQAYPSSKYMLTITDNVNTTYASNRSVFTVYVINSSNNALVLTSKYYQQQLPLEVTFSNMYYLNLSLACDFSANGKDYVSDNTYGLLASTPCGTNYTTRAGGYYTAYYSQVPVTTTTKTTTTTTAPTTTATTTVAPSISITSKAYNISILISASMPASFNVTPLHVLISVYTNSTVPVKETITIHNITSTAPKPPIGEYLIAALNATMYPIQKNATLAFSYPSSIPSNSIGAYRLVNGTWVKIPYKVNATLSTITLNLYPPGPVAITTTKPTVTTTSTASTSIATSTVPVAPAINVYDYIAAIAIIIIIAISAYLASRVSRSKANAPMQKT